VLFDIRNMKLGSVQLLKSHRLVKFSLIFNSKIELNIKSSINHEETFFRRKSVLKSRPNKFTRKDCDIIYKIFLK